MSQPRVQTAFVVPAIAILQTAHHQSSLLPRFPSAPAELNSRKLSVSQRNTPPQHSQTIVAQNKKDSDFNDADFPKDTSGFPQSRQRIGGPLGFLGDIVSGFTAMTGLRTPKSEFLSFEDEDTDFAADEEPPTVLVVGATGETGRIIVRKLLIRGFGVRVLVRNLYSSTLDLLGSRCSYVRGDLRDVDSVYEAVEGVDKIIYAAGPKGEDNQDSSNGSDGDFKEDVAIKSLLRAFQDVRHMDYGRAESTKVTLIKFTKPGTIERWVPNDDPEGRQLARFGLVKGKPARVNVFLNARGNAVFVGQVFDTFNGIAEISCYPKKCNLSKFSGLIIRCMGNGKRYSVALKCGDKNSNIQFISSFDTVEGKFQTVRLPFSLFDAVSTSSQARDVPMELDRGNIRQIAIQYSKAESPNPEKDDGTFYLAMSYIKAYRTQDEPDFVMISQSELRRNIITRKSASEDESPTAEVISRKRRAEEAVKNSGVSYCIARAPKFNDQPGGRRALEFKQGVSAMASGSISRADMAEVCVSALLDPRAVNVTFDVAESAYAPTARTPNKDISSLLETLKPNT